MDAQCPDRNAPARTGECCPIGMVSFSTVQSGFQKLSGPAELVRAPRQGDTIGARHGCAAPRVREHTMNAPQPLFQSAIATWRSGSRELWGLLAPRNCIGCGRPPQLLCEDCNGQLRAEPRLVTRAAPHVWNDPLTVRVGLSYTGAVRNVIGELKTHGTHSIARSLAGTLHTLALSEPRLAEVDVLVLPPSRASAVRRRGFTPIELVARAAGMRASSPFRFGRAVRDQRGLNASERAANLADALVARRRLGAGAYTGLAAARVLLLDDVVTTGATLLEVRRAVRAAGGEVIAVWALAETPRS